MHFFFKSFIVIRRYHHFTHRAANHCCQSLNRDGFRSSENDVQLKLDFDNTTHPHTLVIFIPGLWGSPTPYTRRAGNNTLYSFRSWEEES